MEDFTAKEASVLKAAGKLTDSNYREWVFRMKIKLEAYDVWEITSGEEPKPTGMTAEAKKEIRDWKKRDAQARILIVNCLSSSQLELIAEETISKAIWDRLRELNKPTGMA